MPERLCAQTPETPKVSQSSPRVLGLVRLSGLGPVNRAARIGRSISTWLVVHFNHPEKYNKVNGKDDIPYYGKIKFMFETTNQYWYSISYRKVQPNNRPSPSGRLSCWIFTVHVVHKDITYDRPRYMFIASDESHVFPQAFCGRYQCKKNNQLCQNQHVNGIMGLILIPPVIWIMIYPNIWWFYAWCLMLPSGNLT